MQAIGYKNGVLYYKNRFYFPKFFSTLHEDVALRAPPLSNRVITNYKNKQTRYNIDLKIYKITMAFQTRN